MVFSSLGFLFLFLPIVLALHAAAPHAARNAVLLVASLLFYASGEGWYVLVMLVSIGANYGFGLAIEAAPVGRARRATLAVAVAGNLLLLFWFKYANFVVDQLNVVLPALALSPVEFAPIHLPIGISFFTFQAISYVVDVARGEVAAQRDPVRYGTFKALFPQLIAGPIVRYKEVAGALVARTITLADFAAGAERFVVGLGKKVLIANVVAMPADAAFQADPGALTSAMAWFGIACYALQIYFDFSGYSDMAIGLGRMLGFRFPENFDHPYSARSVREFWRRWHMTLSRWFRDYVYLPLGGSRAGRARTALNLVTVFLLCGLWHGASWNFAIWGLWHGAFIALEHVGLGRRLDASPRWVGHGYLVLVVLTGWVWFRADNADAAVAYGATMLGLGAGTPSVPWSELVNPEVATAAFLGVLGAFGLGARAHAAIRRTAADSVVLMRGWLTAKLACLTLVMMASMIALAASTINPFIYFRF
jgi:alginate O-acetyltransferase complex protein AlgI